MVLNFGMNINDLSPRVWYKSAERMDEVENGSVDLVITSPPYGSIKDYGIPEQIGFFDSFDDYFARLLNAWKECFRVLKPGRRLVINVGDQYLRAKDHGRYRIVPIGARITGDCTGVGFDFLGDIIWQKISTTNTSGGCSLMGSLFYPRNGLLTYDYEHVLIFKKVGKEPKNDVDREFMEYSKIPLDEWKRWYVGHWRFPGTVQDEHVAMFPDELPYRIIRMFSAIGDVVLDPFAGSGTTMKVAKSLLRRSIGYEVNPGFKATIEDKIRDARPGLFIDFQHLMNLLFTARDEGGFDFDFDFAARKSVACLRDRGSGKRAVLDYLVLDDMTGNLDAAVGQKLKENNFQNYMQGAKEWNAVDAYIIVVNGTNAITATIEKRGPDHKPYWVMGYNSIRELKAGLSKFFQ